MKVEELANVINTLNVMYSKNISLEEQDDLFKTFIVKDHHDYDDYIYFCFTGQTNERHPDDHFREGVITKKEYETIKNTPPDEDIQFDSVAKYVDIYCLFKYIQFFDDKEKVLDYLNNGNDETNIALMDFFH